MDKSRGEFLIDGCVFTLGLLIFFLAKKWVDPSFVPGILTTLFPKIAGLGMGITAGLHLVKGGSYRWILQSFNNADKHQRGEEKRTLVFIILFLAYYFLILYTGFILATIISLFMYLRYAGEKRMTILLLVSIITPLFLYFIFQILMKVQIPVGILFS